MTGFRPLGIFNAGISVHPQLKGLPVPHIMIEGTCHPESFFNGFQPVTHQAGGIVLKTKTCFLSHTRDEALIDVVVVENKRPQNFYISIQNRDDGVMVRLLPATSPEKTDGVKQMLVFIGSQVKAQHDDCRFGATNLQAFLPSQ